MPRHPLVREPRGGPADHRGLARSLQRGTAAPEPRLPDAGGVGRVAAPLRVSGSGHAGTGAGGRRKRRFAALSGYPGCPALRAGRAKASDPASDVRTSDLALPGHIVEFSFTRDAACARRRLDRIVDGSERAARSLGLDVSDVLDERRRTLAGALADETSLVVLYTRPDALTREEAKEERKRAARSVAEAPAMVRAGNPAGSMGGVHVRHVAMVDALARCLHLAGQLARPLDVREILQETRAALYPATAPFKDEWSPRLPEWAAGRSDAKPFANMPETAAEFATMDFSHLFEPKFDRQLATEEAILGGAREVRLGDRIFSSFDMTLPPETLPDFNELVTDLAARSIDLP